MEKFEQKQHLQRVILTALEKEPLRREPLLKRVYAACGSTAKFASVFKWLLQKGYIAKSSPKHTAPFAITWKGKQYLAGLEAEEEAEK